MTAGTRINCSRGVGSKAEKNYEFWVSANPPLVPSQGTAPLLGSFQLNRIKITPHIHAQSLVCLGILHSVFANTDHYVNTILLLMTEISPYKKTSPPLKAYPAFHKWFDHNITESYLIFLLKKKRPKSIELLCWREAYNLPLYFMFLKDFIILTQLVFGVSHLKWLLRHLRVESPANEWLLEKLL